MNQYSYIANAGGKASEPLRKASVGATTPPLGTAMAIAGAESAAQTSTTGETEGRVGGGRVAVGKVEGPKLDVIEVSKAPKNDAPTVEVPKIEVKPEPKPEPVKVEEPKPEPTPEPVKAKEPEPEPA